MRKLHVFASAMILLLIVTSCGLTGNGFGGNSIQKRKYTKGFYFNKNRHYHGQEEETAGFKLENSDDAVAETSDETVTPLQVRTVDPGSIGEQQTIQSEKQTQQRQEEKKKKSATQVRKEVKPSTVRQRKPREHEFYIPMKEKTKTLSKAASSSDTGMLILLVILAFLIPPLAVFIYEGATSRFWIDLVLAIIGYGVGFWLLGGLGWLCALAAVIYALLIVLEVI